MAKTSVADPEIIQQKKDKRGRKKQARREARMMLKVELAKKGVQKAEQKVAKAQAKLEKGHTRLRILEQKLDQARSLEQLEEQQEPQLQSLNGTSPHQEQLPITTSIPQADTEAIEAFHAASITPSEGRADIAIDQETADDEEQSAQPIASTETSSISEPTPTDISVNQPLTEAASDAALSDIAQTDTTTPDDAVLTEASQDATESAESSDTATSTEEQTTSTGTARRRHSRRTQQTDENTEEEKQ